MVQDLIDFLCSAPAFFVATEDGDQARVRPFGLAFEHNGMLCFGTSNQKPIYRQLQANPRCEICAIAPSGEWIRITGTAKFLNDRSAKEKAFAAKPELIALYKDTNNPFFQVFALIEGEATVYGITSEGCGPQRNLKL